MAKRVRSRFLDFTRGLRSGVSEIGTGPQHFLDAENVEFRPYRAASVRSGTQKLSQGLSAYPPHSLMEWVSPSGTSQKYEMKSVSVASAPTQFERVTSAARIAQTAPYTLGTSRLLSSDQLQASLWACELGGTNELMFYRASNPAETWLSGNLVKPGATLTLTPGGGGALTTGVGQHYWYRLRWVYFNGSSQASTPQDSGAMGVNTSVNVTTIPLGARSDYLYWILERTDALGSANGPFYFLAQGTANNYNDLLADADLGYQSDEIIHSQLPLADGSHTHLDGILALNDRLVGWYGSTLYLSQPIGGDEATGPANWDARNAYDFGKDDGDSITTCVKQADRLLVFKQNSLWALEGTDPSNFRVVHLFQGAGAAGLRAAACMGSLGWFFGSAGLHSISGNTVKPFGYVEVGDRLKTISVTRYPNVVIRNHQGQRVLIAYSDDGVANGKILVYDQRFGSWSLWSNIWAEDLLVPKVKDFGTPESFLVADPRVDTAHFGAITNNQTISGIGIPGLALVSPAVTDGATLLTITIAATATGFANLTIGSTVYPNCYTENGSTTVRIGKYQPRIAFYGTKDDREYDGSGGIAIPITLRTPWIDDGAPDVYKTWERLEVYAQGSGLTLTATINTDPDTITSSLSLTLPGTGALWGGFNWGDGTLWSVASQDGSAAQGLEQGLIARRYRLRFRADLVADFVFKGYTLDGIIQPERRYS